MCAQIGTEQKNQTIKAAQKIKESNPTSIPLIPSHSKMKIKTIKIPGYNPGKYRTLLTGREVEVPRFANLDQIEKHSGHGSVLGQQRMQYSTNTHIRALHKPGADQSKSLGIPPAGLLDVITTSGSRTSNLAEIVCLAKLKASWKDLPLTRSSW